MPPPIGNQAKVSGSGQRLVSGLHGPQQHGGGAFGAGKHKLREFIRTGLVVVEVECFVKAECHVAPGGGFRGFPECADGGRNVHAGFAVCAWSLVATLSRITPHGRPIRTLYCAREGTVPRNPARSPARLTRPLATASSANWRK